MMISLVTSENVIEEICCVCEHPLESHIEEGDGWRCHHLGKDGYQCECFLRKARADNDIAFYSKEKRLQETL